MMSYFGESAPLLGLLSDRPHSSELGAHEIWQLARRGVANLLWCAPNCGQRDQRE